MSAIVIFHCSSALCRGKKRGVCEIWGGEWGEGNPHRGVAEDCNLLVCYVVRLGRVSDVSQFVAPTSLGSGRVQEEGDSSWTAGL